MSDDPGPSRARAAVQTAAEELEVRSVDVPADTGDDEAILRVAGNGICGADYERYTGEFDDSGLFEYPVILGHEPVGYIERIGPLARQRWGVEAGDFVAVEPWAPCGVCERCTAGEYTICDDQFIYGTTSTSVGSGLWGGFADYMHLRGNTIVHPISPDCRVEDATLFNPLGAGFEWVVRAGGLEVGDDVLVMGPGQRGIASVLAAAEAGARRIFVSGLPADAARLALAERFGATHTVDVEASDLQDRIETVTDGRGVDVVVDTTPGATQPVIDGIGAVRAGGTVVLAGTKGMAEVEGFVSDKLVMDNIRLQGTLGTRSWSFARAIDAIESGDYPFEELHSHTLGLESVERAIRLLGDSESAFHVTVVPEN